MKGAVAWSCALVLAGCAAGLAPPPERPGAMRLACDGGESVSVRLFGDEAHVSGLGPDPQVLLRDAGGVSPRQSVFSNADWRAELGLGADGRDAVLRQLQPQQRTLNCRRS